MYSYFLGFDVSKATLNYCLRQGGQMIEEGAIDNTTAKAKALLKRLAKQHQFSVEELLICVENTGLYTNRLLAVKLELDCTVWLEDPFQINRSIGRQRDKTDVVDARLIAEYAQRFADKVDPYELPSVALEMIHQLHDLRQVLVGANQRLTTSAKERKSYGLYAKAKVIKNAKMTTIIKRQIRQTKQNIKELERLILQEIAQDTELKEIYDLTRSVPGMGPVTAVSVLVNTQCFKKVKTALKCASYAGISPHRRQSGKLLNASSRVTKGHVELKTAFHQAAHCLIGHKGIFRDLYDRLRAKNKTYCQAINAVRNKVIRVLYACVTNNRRYDKKLHQKLA